MRRTNRAWTLCMLAATACGTTQRNGDAGLDATRADGLGTDSSTTDGAQVDATRADAPGRDGTVSTDAAHGGSGDPTGDTLVPWAGGPSYYQRFPMGVPARADFFPVFVWLQSPRNASRYAAVGINLYVGQYNDPSDADFTTLHSANMPVAMDQDSVGLAHVNDLEIFAWTQQDEPDNAQPIAGGGYGPCVTPDTLITRYQGFHGNDNTRPVFLNFGQGVAWDGWYGRGSCTGDTAYYGMAASAGDILSFDIYPMNASQPDVAGKPWLVAYGVDRLRMWSNDSKPVWNWIECTRISDTDGPGPTPAETRAEVWMSLIHGSMGVGYFAHTISPFDETGLLDDATMSDAVTQLDAQIQRLAPVLNTQSIANAVTVTSSDPAIPIDTMAKRTGGALYVFAVAMRPGNATATFAIRGAPATGHIDVVDEGRTVDLVGGAFRDDFSGYGVHVYRVTY